MHREQCTGSIHCIVDIAPVCFGPRGYCSFQSWGTWSTVITGGFHRITSGFCIYPPFTHVCSLRKWTKPFKSVDLLRKKPNSFLDDCFQNVQAWKGDHSVANLSYIRLKIPGTVQFDWALSIIRWEIYVTKSNPWHVSLIFQEDNERVDEASGNIANNSKQSRWRERDRDRVRADQIRSDEEHPAEWMKNTEWLCSLGSIHWLTDALLWQYNDH